VVAELGAGGGDGGGCRGARLNLDFFSFLEFPGKLSWQVHWRGLDQGLHPSLSGEAVVSSRKF
jgi:hypothetical protein